MKKKLFKKMHATHFFGWSDGFRFTAAVIMLEANSVKLSFTVFTHNVIRIQYCLLDLEVVNDLNFAHDQACASEKDMKRNVRYENRASNPFF